MRSTQLAFALDVPSLDDARTWVLRLAEHVDVFKVGLEQFIGHGPRAVQTVTQAGKACFLDLKLHDIPETMFRAVAMAKDLGVRYLTLHAAAGAPAIEKCAALQTNTFSLLAVTVLTSLDTQVLASFGIEESARTHASRLAKLAIQAGARGLVCSPLELGTLRTTLGSDIMLVTPGIRPAQKLPTLHGRIDDQKRVATPRAAKQGGADMIVVGRPIRDAQDPVAVATAIRTELHA